MAGRKALNEADCFVQFRVNKKMRRAFNEHAKATGFSAGSLLRQMMYDELPKSLIRKHTVVNPTAVDYIDQDYRKADHAASEGDSEQEQATDRGSLAVHADGS